MEPAAAAKALAAAMPKPKGPLTVADASVASGLALRDAEAALHWLTSEYRGHLRVGESGDLLYVFPTGFTKPWETRDAIARASSRVAKALFGIGRLVVRAWILVVMVGYAALFVALLVALSFAGRSSDRDRGPNLGFLGPLLRVIGEAFFWTFHPFSPFYTPYAYAPPVYSGRRARAPAQPDVPFYEKVNRFVFGPAEPPVDDNAQRAMILDEIRARKGRIGLADVMRVTGLPREEADPLMARLMLDYDGDVDVGEQGGIVYRFEAIRKTASTEMPVARAAPAWERARPAPVLTGNSGAANVGVALLNAFNLGMGAFALSNGLTVTNVMALFSKHPPPVLPDHGTAIALGVVPLLFSALLFVLPIARAALLPGKRAQVAKENARLAVLREVLARAPKKQPVPDEALRAAVRVATGKEPTSKEVTRRVVELGGDVDVGPQGEVRYRFADLEAEAEAVSDERAAASEREAKVGRIVFASDA